MIQIVVYKNSDKKYIGLKAAGHAGFARRGKDIVCAAISALITGTINSIEAFTEEELRLKTDDSKALMAFKFKEPAGERAELLMDSLVLGIQGIEENYYNKGYVHLTIKEV